MKRQWLLKALALGGFLGVASVTLSAQPVGSALPGTVNYLEGQVSINGTAVMADEIGKAHVATDQLLATGSGKAEVLLAPGTFVRVGDNSRIRMDSLGIV